MAESKKLVVAKGKSIVAGVKVLVGGDAVDASCFLKNGEQTLKSLEAKGYVCEYKAPKKSK